MHPNDACIFDEIHVIIRGPDDPQGFLDDVVLFHIFLEILRDAKRMQRGHEACLLWAAVLQSNKQLKRRDDDFCKSEHNKHVGGWLRGSEWR